MKNHYAIGLAAGAVLVTVAIEESRISALRSQAPEPSIVQRPAPRPAATPAPETAAAPPRTKSRPVESDASAKPPAAETEGESFARSVRKMFDNPAGKSLLGEQAKMVVAMQYQKFIDGLNLTAEESEYFKELLGKEIADQQEIGMKMLGATPEEQKELAGQIAERNKESQQAIREFLNNEEDYQAFTRYRDHLPEQQQLSAIRATMSREGVPLDAGAEEKLVEAMHKARTQANLPDLSGAAGIQAIQDGNLTETFEKNWEHQQETLTREVSQFLDEKQMAAFTSYQKQMKDLQMMSIRMAEKMMSGKQDDE